MEQSECTELNCGQDKTEGVTERGGGEKMVRDEVKSPEAVVDEKEDEGRMKDSVGRGQEQRGKESCGESAKLNCRKDSKDGMKLNGCSWCGAMGHSLESCRSEMMCLQCRQVGHRTWNCPRWGQSMRQ
jgi:hypothetical protein